MIGLFAGAEVFRHAEAGMLRVVLDKKIILPTPGFWFCFIDQAIPRGRAPLWHPIIFMSCGCSPSMNDF